MKRKFYVLKKLMWTIILLMCNQIFAQEYPNPFIDNKNTFNSKDIIILYNEEGTNNIVQRVFGYDWVAYYADQSDNLVVPITEDQTLENTNLGSGSFLSSSAGMFNDDRREDIAYIIEKDDVIQVGMNTLHSEFVDADSSYLYELNEPVNYVEIPISPFSGAPKNAVGDMDGDGTDEIAIAYWDQNDGLVHIQVLDADNGDSFALRASIGDQESLRINGKNAFDLSCGDLNGDGADELILIGLEESTSGDSEYQVFVKVYEVNNTESNSIQPKAYLVMDDSNIINDPDDNNNMVSYIQTAVVGLMTHSNELEDQSKDIFASFAYLLSDQESSNYTNYFQYLLRSNADLSELSIIHSISSYASTANFNYDYPIEAKTGDLNGDDIQDVVLMMSGGKIYTVIEDSIMFKGNNGGIVLDENNSGILESIDRFEIGDVDIDGRDEIITFSKGESDFEEHSFYINISGVLEDFSTDTLGGAGFIISDQNVNSNLRSYSIAVGNLDGKDLKFGEPEIFDCNYKQPLFIIGAIPSHFDIINDVAYDVNNCYPEQDCDLEVTITQSQSSSTTAEVQLNSDWAVSTSLDVSGSAGIEGGPLSSGIEMGTTIEAKYGVKFSEISSETNTQTITVAVSASSDDVIQYLQIPITVYRYPVLDAANDTVCNFIAAFPATDASPQTIVANGKSVFNYLPDYEIGNIFSYPSISSGFDGVSDLPHTAGNWIIYDEDISYTMSPSGGITYNISSQNDLDWSSSSESYGAVDTGVSTGGFGIGLPENEDGTEYLDAAGLSTDYPPNAIEINMLDLYSNHISNQTDFYISPTNIIGSPNEFNYLISPKIYWNTDGSGIVSFELDINNDPGSGSFWTTAYDDESDPALNLPYRYDLYHNPNLSNTENLDRTKSLHFSTNIPQENDTISAFVKIFNYSFVATGQAVEFELYYEDPDNGGTIIEDINGNTLFQTATGLGERGRAEVEVKFLSTSELILDDFVKIYVVLDPNDLISEIHEENNKGWAQLGYYCNDPSIAIGIDENPDLFEAQELMKAYPVPANEQLIIEHDLRSLHSSKAQINIYDLMGKAVAHFSVSSNYEGKVYWNTRSVNPGIYLVNLVTEQGVVESKKVIITR